MGEGVEDGVDVRSDQVSRDPSILCGIDNDRQILRLEQLLKASKKLWGASPAA